MLLQDSRELGGLGSGTWYRCFGKPAVEDGLKLDLGRLIRHRNVIPGSHVSGSLVWSYVSSGERVASIGYEADLRDPYDAWMRLHYRNNDEPHDYRVSLTTTRPNYGGRRWWFVCPVRHARVAQLHKPAGGDIFASRMAYGLVYRSQNESRADRLTEKSHSIRRKLGGEPGFGQALPKKPKGMHWRTYWRLCDEILRSETQSWSAAAIRFGIEF